MTPSEQPQKHRISDLMGMYVESATGRAFGTVNDVRLAPGQAVHGIFPELVVEGFIVGPNHPGSLLGYDRSAEKGPWLVRSIIRWLHRDAGYLPWAAVQDLDWAARRLVVNVESLSPLAGPNDQRV